MHPSNRRIVFLDVDGTLIDSGERIADSTIAAVRTARANGHLLFLCTGRASSEIFAGVRDLGFDGIISAGGGFAEIDGEVVISREMPGEAVDRMVDFFHTAGLDYYLQTVDGVHPSAGVPRHFQRIIAAEEAARAVEPEPTQVVGSVVDGNSHPAEELYAATSEMPRAGVAKAIFLGDDQGAFARVRDELAGEFTVITGTIPHLGSGCGEVSLPEVNKGSTIDLLLDHLGLTREQSIAIGDSYNDLEMLAVAGVGIAMGNAPEDVKSHADEVTTTVLDDGVWNALSRHGLV